MLLSGQPELRQDVLCSRETSTSCFPYRGLGFEHDLDVSQVSFSTGPVCSSIDWNVLHLLDARHFARKSLLRPWCWNRAFPLLSSLFDLLRNFGNLPYKCVREDRRGIYIWMSKHGLLEKHASLFHDASRLMSLKAHRAPLADRLIGARNAGRSLIVDKGTLTVSTLQHRNQTKTQFGTPQSYGVRPNPGILADGSMSQQHRQPLLDMTWHIARTLSSLKVYEEIHSSHSFLHKVRLIKIDDAGYAVLRWPCG